MGPVAALDPPPPPPPSPPRPSPLAPTAGPIILDAAGCGALVESYGIQPGVSWGTANASVQEQYTASSCNIKICVYWRSKYSVVPFVTYGSLSADLQPLWDLPRSDANNQTCNELSGLLDSSECGALVETYGIVPGSSWGSAGANVQGLYTASLCDTRVCAYWRTKYSVVPFLEWGSFPQALQNAWSFVRQPSGKTCNELSGPLDPSGCGGLVEAFNVTPGVSYGSLTPSMRLMYDSSDCDSLICQYWTSKYDVIPTFSWGSLPAAMQPAWDRVRASGRNCNAMSGPLEPAGCGVLVEAFNVTPGVSYGSLPPALQQLYESSDCDSRICEYWTSKYDVVPTVSWGSLPAAMQPSWDRVRASGRSCNAMSGPLDSAGCGELVAAYNITPGYGMGSAVPLAAQLYEDSKCLNSVCEYWRAAYGVVPFLSYGSLPTYLQPSWDYPRTAYAQNCNELSGPLGASECGALQEAFGIVPGSTWGSAPESVQRVWASSNCEEQICTYWRSKYGVVPFVTYGSLPPSLQPGWNHLRAGSNLTCNTLSGPLDAAACGAVSDLYNVFPGVSWGRLDGAEARAAWDANGCNSHLCSHWATKYEIKPWVSYGRLAAGYKFAADPTDDLRRQSWDWPRYDNGNLTCNSLAGLLDSDSCGKLTEYFGVQPGFTWGNITGEAREMYDASTCDVNVCEYWRYKYGVVPGVTWGRMPESLKPSWQLARAEADNMTCNELVSGNTALVQRFAPVLRFYGSGQGFPMTAETYYTAGCTTKDCPMGDWLNQPRDTKAHVYYAVSTCGEQVRIKFHFFYAWQAPCNPNTPLPQATHQSDWEAVTVILDRDRRRVSAVQFEQHGGWYTRLAGKGGFETSGGRPVVYVGFQAHGAYHSAQAPVTGLEEERCSYYGDWRGSSLSWNTGSTVLVDLMAPSPETWIQAIRNAPNGEILWGAGKRISFRTDQWQPKCDARACTGHGYDITALLNIGVSEAGCARSQCPMGWKDTKVLGCYRCPKGYIDCGPLMCAKGSSRWNCANPFNKRKKPSTMGYAYVLSTSDQGLLYD
ncbi:hypothetical protein HYH03_008688 [Edaphochlamys debaryana]|uniref:Uncharacterized protein n=1 Tax=Edaphochlamys debaryana TaxID=47281 RepID=A0A835Y5U2_9CHLO|nr:hypothetical protein HYH03_008688 [Edaphochlamys debaryana]|eukprot:KAG2493025.1 hypothetical protein HYH03_008688 [Edaphochlamys debaryana]